MPSFAHIIAENPYDEMGAEFQKTFGQWVDETELPKDYLRTTSFNILAFELFKHRLKLAQKYKTFFASQMVQGERELWRERFIGQGNNPCYSFAIKSLPRTQRFFAWCQQAEQEGIIANKTRNWDTTLSSHPTLPNGPHTPWKEMPLWTTLHSPQFRARKDGPFELRRLRYSDDVYLFEHVRNHWVPNLRTEAQQHWNLALDPDLEPTRRYTHLSMFEYLWYWTNPFGRAGALTGDALSLVVQKTMQAEGLKNHMRDSYYHQDCEALILPRDTYIQKRVQDCKNGFVPHFPMTLALAPSI